MNLEPVRSRTNRRSRSCRTGVAAIVGAAVLLASCTTTGGSDEGGSEPTTDLDTVAAAEVVQATIDEGDPPENCPLGLPETLSTAVADDVDLPAEMGAEADDRGIVFNDGEVDFVSCVFADFRAQPGEVFKLRIDVAPGSSINLETYLDEQFPDVQNATTTSIEGFDGGDASQMCWADSTECLVMWHGAGLFVAVTFTVQGGEVDPDAATEATRSLVKVLVTRLADGSARNRFDIATSSADAPFDTAAAAKTAQAAIDQGDSLGDCPMGTPTDLIAAAEGDPLLAPGLAMATDDGQVFSGGDIDITYCALFATGTEPSQIADLRIDVAPGRDIKIDTYLDEEFVYTEDTMPVAVDAIAGGAVSAACWDDGADCGIFWQADNLFIAIVGMTDGGTLNAADLATIAEHLIPVAGTHLAEG